MITQMFDSTAVPQWVDYHLVSPEKKLAASKPTTREHYHSQILTLTPTTTQSSNRSNGPTQHYPKDQPAEHQSPKTNLFPRHDLHHHTSQQNHLRRRPSRRRARRRPPLHYGRTSKTGTGQLEAMSSKGGRGSARCSQDHALCRWV